MKKAIALILAVFMIVFMSACSSQNSQREGTAVTFKQSEEQPYKTNMVETNEGIYIMCSSPYVLGPEENTEQFLVMWDSTNKKSFDNASEREKVLTFISNASIYRMKLNYNDGTSEIVECYDDIAQIVDIKSIESFVLNFSYDYQNYYAMFTVSGA